MLEENEHFYDIMTINYLNLKNAQKALTHYYDVK